MRKATLTIAIIVLCLLAKAGFSQKKDSTASYDTVYVFRPADVNALKAILMNAKLVSDNGQPLSGNDIMWLMKWMDDRRTLIPKTKK